MANVALGRTQTKEEYGIFALSYSAFSFLAGLYNAAILEAYTIYGSGRYHQRFSEYARLFWRCNCFLNIWLTAALALLWAAFDWIAPAYMSHTFLGMALGSGVLLTALFVRRNFYMRRRPDLAARFSAVFFFCLLALLWLSMRAGILNGFSVFMMVALAWAAAGGTVAGELPGGVPGSLKRAEPDQGFLAAEPDYWRQHWKYSRWVLVTAFVFQATTQGYYWLAAGFLSVKEAGDLRAMYNLVTPVDQVFVATALLILPMFSFRYASRGLAGLVPLWRAYCACCIAVTGGFAACVILFGKTAMHALYAGRFDDVAPLAGVLALLPLVMGIGNTMNAALKAVERPNAVFLAYVASGAATFLIGLPLVIHLGLRGAVYGMLVSGGVYTATMGIAFFSFAHTQNCPATLAGAVHHGREGA